MEVVSAIASVGSLIGGVTAVATHLNNIKERYQYAPLNVTLVASSLWTVKTALEAIDRWRKTTKDSSDTSEQLDKDLTLSLEACACLISVIDRKLKDVDLLNPSRYERARFVALDAIFKDFTSNLDAQVRGLQLLLQVYQCQTMSERTERLKRSDTRKVFRELEENTVSLNLEDQDLADAVSILSDEPSVNLEVDHILLNSPLYRKVYGDRYLRRVKRLSGVPVVSPRNSLPESSLEAEHRHRRNRSKNSNRVADPVFIAHGSIPFLGIPFQGEQVDDESSESGSETTSPKTVKRTSNATPEGPPDSSSATDNQKEVELDEQPSETIGVTISAIEQEPPIIEASSSKGPVQESRKIVDRVSDLVSQDNVQAATSSVSSVLDLEPVSDFEEVGSRTIKKRRSLFDQNRSDDVESTQNGLSETEEGGGISLTVSSPTIPTQSNETGPLESAIDSQSALFSLAGQEKPQTPAIIEPHTSPKQSAKDASSEHDGNNAFKIDFGEDLNLAISAPLAGKRTLQSSAMAIIGTPVSDSPTLPTTRTSALSTPSSSVADMAPLDLPSADDASISMAPTPSTCESSVTTNSSGRESAQDPSDPLLTDSSFPDTTLIPNANIVSALRGQIYAKKRNPSPASIKSESRSEKIVPSGEKPGHILQGSPTSISTLNKPGDVLQGSPAPVSPKSPDKTNIRHSLSSSPKMPVSVFNYRSSTQPIHPTQAHFQGAIDPPPPVPKRTPPPIPQESEQEPSNGLDGQDDTHDSGMSLDDISTRVRSVSSPMTASEPDHVLTPIDVVKARRGAEPNPPILSIPSPAASTAQASNSISNSPSLPSSSSPLRPTTASFPLPPTSIAPPIPPRPSTSSLSRAMDLANKDSSLNRASSKIVRHSRSDTAPSSSGGSHIETTSSRTSESTNTPETASMQSSSTVATGRSSNDRRSVDSNSYQTNITSTLTVPSAIAFGQSTQMNSNSIAHALKNHLGVTPDGSAIDNAPKKMGLRHRLSGLFGADKATRIKLLHEAAHEGNIPLLESCLQDCSIRDVQSPSIVFNEVTSKTPLMRAAAAGHVSCIERIVKVGSDFKTADKLGRNALHYAIISGRLEAVKWLAERYRIVAANPAITLPPGPLEITDGENRGSLALATTTGNVEIMEVLIRNGARLEATDPENQQTPLFTAISYHKLDAVKLLLHYGANVHHRNKCQETPLIFAAKVGMTEVVTHLLEKGASWSAQDVNGDYAVHHACRYGHLDIVEQLYLTIEDLEVKNSIGERPIHVAATSNHHLVLKALLQIGCSPNLWTEPPLKSSGKKSAPLASAPLHYACRSGHYDVANDLIAYGALVNSALEDGTSPLMLACEAKDLATANLLLGKGANVNAQKESDHNTPLHIAVAKGELDIVKQLLDYGAEALKTNKKGESPHAYAASLGPVHPEIIKYLTKHQSLVKHMHGPNRFNFTTAQSQAPNAPNTTFQHTNPVQPFYSPGYPPAATFVAQPQVTIDAGRLDPLTGYFNPADDMTPSSAPPAYHTLPPRQRPTGR